jgi:F0F1-type ATP synthase membrane subunit b/b'
MITINPLLPFFPESLSFLIYGLVTGLLLKFWKIAKRNIFIILFFLYAYGVWIASMYLLMFGQSQIRQAWFLFGFALTFIQIFSIIRTIAFSPFTWAFETITDRVQERRADRRDQYRQAEREEREQNNRTEQERNQDLFRAEQARREAEARANRARGARDGEAGNEQTRTDNDQIEDHRNQERRSPPPRERRSDEQILGLSSGWTQEDLKNAYKRESQRTHPDKWIGKPQAMQDMMEVEYKAVQEAYRRLKE